MHILVYTSKLHHLCPIKSGFQSAEPRIRVVLPKNIFSKLECTVEKTTLRLMDDVHLAQI